MSTSVCLFVCLSVCVCLSVREHIFRTTRAIFAKFCACCLWPWLGPPPAGCRIPRRMGNFRGFSYPLTMHCMGCIAVRISLQRTAWA